MRFLVSSLLLITSSVAAAQQGAAKSFQFQGLPWGASEAQIAARFGKPLRYAECPESLSKASVERFQEICESPVVEPYEVAGVPFSLSLTLSSTTRRLSSVVLFYEGEISPTPDSTNDSTWRQNYSRLLAALTDRYGKPESSKVRGVQGITRAEGNWRVEGATILLESTLISVSTPAREQHQIIYRQSGSGPGGKL